MSGARRRPRRRSSAASTTWGCPTRPGRTPCGRCCCGCATSRRKVVSTRARWSSCCGPSRIAAGSGLETQSSRGRLADAQRLRGRHRWRPVGLPGLRQPVRRGRGRRQPGGRAAVPAVSGCGKRLRVRRLRPTRRDHPRNGPTGGPPQRRPRAPRWRVEWRRSIATPSPLADEPTMVQSSPAFDDDIDLELDFRPGYTEPEIPRLRPRPLGAHRARRGRPAAGRRHGRCEHPRGRPSGRHQRRPRQRRPPRPLPRMPPRAQRPGPRDRGDARRPPRAGRGGAPAGARWWSQRDAAPSPGHRRGRRRPRSRRARPRRHRRGRGGAHRRDGAAHSGQRALQWVKLTDAEGDTVARAKPTATATAAPGAYTLSAEVRAAPASRRRSRSKRTRTCPAPSRTRKIRCGRLAMRPRTRIARRSVWARGPSRSPRSSRPLSPRPTPPETPTTTRTDGQRTRTATTARTG